MMEEVLKYAGPILFVGLQCSNTYTALSIARRQSVGKLSPVPFASLFVNCLIWSLYGRMVKSPSIQYPNMSGLFVSTFCLTLFDRYALVRPWEIYGILLAMSVLCVYLYKTGNDKAIGMIGCLLSIVVSGSPLAVLRTVWREKSTAALPLATSLITWINNLSWVLFGLFVVHDPLIYVPNILGFILASMQMGLFVLFGLPPVLKKEDGPTTKANMNIESLT